METLLEAAKALGIKPNPNMTAEERNKVIAKLKERLGYRWITPSTIYDYRKRVEQRFDRKRCSDNIRFLKTYQSEGIRIHGQDTKEVFLNEDAVFVWRSASNKGDRSIERFQIELQLDHPDLPRCFKALDAFSKKYKSRYKVTDLGHINRIDPLNVYMHTPITSQIVKELYSIVGPYLKKDHHDRLNGFSIKMNGREIKGIKYAAEPTIYEDLEKKEKDKICRNVCNRVMELPSNIRECWLSGYPTNKFIFHSYNDCPNVFTETASLGQLSASIQYLDLVYYLAGKEGQSPFQLGNQFGMPDGRRYFDKNIDIGTSNTQVKPSEVKAVSSNNATVGTSTKKSASPKIVSNIKTRTSGPRSTSSGRGYNFTVTTPVAKNASPRMDNVSVRTTASKKGRTLSAGSVRKKTTGDVSLSVVSKNIQNGGK